MTGAQTVEWLAGAFGYTLTRTSGVFDLSRHGTLGYIAELTERDSGRSTLYAVEIEMSGGRITSLVERRVSG